MATKKVKRTERIPVLVTSEEKASIERAAWELHMDTAVFMRHAASARILGAMGDDDVKETPALHRAVVSLDKEGGA